MSRLVSKILLAILMLPLAGVFYVFMMVIGDRILPSYFGWPRGTEPEVFLLSSLATWLLVAGYWSLLWKSSVRWNASRVLRTLLAVAAALAAGLLSGLLANAALGRGESGFGAFIGGLMAIILWLVATVFIWRETPAERAARIKASSRSAVTCPTCGYNLTGLSESRCPECGSKFTLDELIALQPAGEAEVD